MRASLATASFAVPAPNVHPAWRRREPDLRSQPTSHHAPIGAL